jgi:hypothetical protein
VPELGIRLYRVFQEKMPGSGTPNHQITQSPVNQINIKAASPALGFFG